MTKDKRTSGRRSISRKVVERIEVRICTLRLGLFLSRRGTLCSMTNDFELESEHVKETNRETGLLVVRDHDFLKHHSHQETRHPRSSQKEGSRGEY